MCSGRNALGSAIISLPLIRRCIISFCPESRSQIKYFPRREAFKTCTPVRPSINASRLVRRTVLSRPTSTLTIVLPTIFSCKPRRTVSTSGSSGISTASELLVNSSAKWCRLVGLLALQQLSSIDHCQNRATHRQYKQRRKIFLRDLVLRQ